MFIDINLHSESLVITANEECDSGWHNFKGKCYKVFGRNGHGGLMYNQSKLICKELFGAEIVTIHSSEEQQFLDNLLQADSGNSDMGMTVHYIGLEYKNGEWKWADATSLHSN